MKAPASRKDALRLGAPVYNTGRPCKRGHFSDRYTASGHCIPCRRDEENSRYNELKKTDPESVKARNARQNRARADKHRVYDARRRAEKGDELARKDRDWYARNREQKRATVRAWVKRNSATVNAKNSLRRAEKLKRTPKWLTEEDLKKIDAAYRTAKQVSEETGVKHEVDHDIPLKGKNVSGLHVPGNLRVIAAERNRRKYNIFNVG